MNSKLPRVFLSLSLNEMNLLPFWSVSTVTLLGNKKAVSYFTFKFLIVNFTYQYCRDSSKLTN